RSQAGLGRVPVGLWSACRVVRMQGWRPTETELGDVAEHVVTFRFGSAFHPCHQIVEGALAHRAVDAAMTRSAYRALHQKMCGPGGQRSAAIVLLQSEGHPEVRRLVDRQQRDLDLSGHLREYGICLARPCARAGGDTPYIAIELRGVQAMPGIDVVANVACICVACKFLRTARARLAW